MITHLHASCSRSGSESHTRVDKGTLGVEPVERTSVCARLVSAISYPPFVVFKDRTGRSSEHLSGPGVPACLSDTAGGDEKLKTTTVTTSRRAWHGSPSDLFGKGSGWS